MGKNTGKENRQSLVFIEKGIERRYIMVKVAVLGYGTIGSGVVEIIRNSPEIINERSNDRIEVKRVLDLRDFPGDPVEDILVHDFQVIAEDPEISVVVETMGGVNPAYEFVKTSLEKGKSVCTSNKELVAKHGAGLIEIARENHVNFLYEASVGGGIPIIRPLHQCLTVDRVEKISGILNGTTNYILTKMTEDGSDFDSVLKEAQALGYAERNPEADVEGYDACRKIAILTSIAYGQQVDFEDIYTEGITKITGNDIKYAKSLNAAIKIFGTSKLEDGKVYAMVSPVMIKQGNPLYSVNDVFNAICVTGNFLGDVMFYGKGAGKLPTASAVVADVVDAVKHKGTNIMQIWKREKMELGSFDECKNRFFVRLAADESNEAKVKAAFGSVTVLDPVVDGEYAFITETMTEAAFRDAIAGFDHLLNRIRVDF